MIKVTVILVKLEFKILLFSCLKNKKQMRMKQREAFRWRD